MYLQIPTHHIDFGDLPPIDQMKQAITRRTVSSGITYLLPCDKTKCSVENIYRNNLRLMFQVMSLLCIGGHRDPILSFLYTSSPKSGHVGGPAPPLMGNPGSATAMSICVLNVESDHTKMRPCVQSKQTI